MKLSALFCSMALAACIRPAKNRFEEDEAMLSAEVDGASLHIVAGQAAIRSLSTTEATLWAQSPALSLELSLDTPAPFSLEVRNCMQDATFTSADITLVPTIDGTTCRFSLPAGTNVGRVGRSDTQEPFRFVAMGDIQTAMDRVDDVFRAISREDNIDFVISMGDIAERGEEDEYELFEKQLIHLNVPFFSTVGNHDITTDADIWRRRYGVFTVHFEHRGVTFTFADSGNASLDPSLHDQMGAWLEEAADSVHIFGTHYPPIDPVGVRQGDFRSRLEAVKLLNRLSQGNVDLTLYGHIHSYYEFENAGMPAYISGGGGALPERLDGIERHFLVIEVDPAEGVVAVDRRDVD